MMLRGLARGTNEFYIWHTTGTPDSPKPQEKCSFRLIHSQSTSIHETAVDVMNWQGLLNRHIVRDPVFSFRSTRLLPTRGLLARIVESLCRVITSG